MESSAVAESATTQSRTSSRIRVVETEDQSNIECHKLMAGICDRHETVVDMDTCGAIVLTKDREDEWTQQVVDRNKKCCGTKSEHLGHLFESQMASERQIMELANIEKLEVAEVVLQEAIGQKQRSSTPGGLITASRIIWSMTATKVIENEQHHSMSDGWRSATTWNEQETDKCWEEVMSIMMGEPVIDVPTTYVSENHGWEDVHRGTNFPLGGRDAESIETECVRMAHRHKNHVTNQTDVVRWRDDGKTQLVQRSEMEPTGIRMEVKQQTC